MNLNLFMAIFWLILGLGLVIYHALNPQQGNFRIIGTDLSAGWLIVVLAIWNVLRWWSARAADKDRQFEEDAAFQRQRKHYDQLSQREPEKEIVNPEFDFSKPLPTEGEGKAEDKPAPPT